MAGVVTARVALNPSGYMQGAEESRQTFDRMLARLQATPGVTHAALTSQAPLGPGSSDNGLIPEGRAMDVSNTIQSRMRIVTPDYLKTLNVRLVAGRFVEASDIAGGSRVMVVSEALAKAAWPGQNAIGKRIACCEGTPSDPRWKTVVGVVGDVHSRGPTQDLQPEFYLPVAQVPPQAWDWIQRTMTIVVRSDRLDVAGLAVAIRAAVHEVDPSLPVFRVQTMEESLGTTLAPVRFNMVLLSVLGGIGLTLAAVGIYGVIAYFVGLRTQEIGVRIALGATPANVLQLMLWQGMRPVIAGLVVGGVAAAWATRLLRGSLFGVSSADPTTMVAVTLAMTAVALVAISGPAWRATRVNPMRALGG
jgi:predicted permease